MSLDLESLACFEAAARLRSFRVAARSVHLSPAAFGERIRKLEEELGVQLFTRTTRRVDLTPAGERALGHARQLLDQARLMRSIARDPSLPAPFDLTLGTRFELGLSWLTPALPILEARRPERRIHLSFGDSPDVLAHVRTGTLDCAVTSARLILPGLRYEVLHEEGYVFVASPRLLRRRPLRGPEDSSEHTLIDVSPELPLFRYFLDAWRGGAPWIFERLSYLGTIAAIRMRVLEGAGVAVLPRYFVAGDLARRRLAVLQPEVALDTDSFRLLWREGHAREPELRELAQELRALPLR